MTSFETIYTLASEGSGTIKAGSVVQARHRGTVVDVHIAGFTCETYLAQTSKVVHLILAGPVV